MTTSIGQRHVAQPFVAVSDISIYKKLILEEQAEN